MGTFGLAASRQFGLNQTDVFAVNTVGGVVVFWVTDAGPWSGPALIGPSDHATPGGELAATQQQGIANQTDLFVVDSQGQLCVAWVTADGPWDGPQTLSAPGFAPPGACVAASPQFGVVNQTDVFVVDGEGRLCVFWVTGEGPWDGPYAISGPGFAPPGACVAASPQFGVPNQTDVFVVDSEGQLSVSWVTADGPWDGPKAITSPRFAHAGAPVVASQQIGIPNQTDVFVANDSDELCVSWVTADGPWQGPEVLGSLILLR